MSESNSGWKGYPYMMQMENFITSLLDTVFVDFGHIERSDSTLASAISDQYYR